MTFGFHPKEDGFDPRTEYVPYRDKEQQKEYQRQWVAARRAKWFEGKTCKVCGSNDNLELDHIDASTKISHSIWSWSWARIAEETAKCQVLCHEHHIEKTTHTEQVERWGYVYQHGTTSMYRNHRCRCDECKEAQAESFRRYRSA